MQVWVTFSYFLNKLMLGSVYRKDFRYPVQKI